MPPKKTPAATRSASARGGSMTTELAKLSVPFGIVLAQNGLRKYLDAQDAKKIAPASKASKKKSAAAKKPVVGGACYEANVPAAEPASLEGGRKKRTYRKKGSSP